MPGGFFYLCEELNKVTSSSCIMRLNMRLKSEEEKMGIWDDVIDWEKDMKDYGKKKKLRL